MMMDSECVARHEIRFYLAVPYRVILKKVSFGIFRIILVSKEEKNFTLETKDKGLYEANSKQIFMIFGCCKNR